LFWTLVGILVFVIAAFMVQPGMIDRVLSQARVGELPVEVPALGVSSDIPPVGTVWFGPTFNPATFEMDRRVSKAPLGGSIAFVGRLREPANGLQVRLTVAGTPTTLPADEVPDGSEVAGGTLNLLFPGDMKVELVDVGGNVLASGTLSVTE
jgi:hypothetical protein